MRSGSHLPARAGGQGGDPFLPQQAIGLTSILTAYTSGSARVNGLGTVAGSIAEGYNADLAVVNADLAHVAAGEICHAEVIQTWIRGRAVYSRG